MYQNDLLKIRMSLNHKNNFEYSSERSGYLAISILLRKDIVLLLDITKNIMGRKIVKVKFVDFYSGFNEKNNEFVEVINKKYKIEFSNQPDYVIYSCFGNEHLKYSCIRIFYTGECVTPNFNECDYAIGFDRMDFGKRYLRLPLYKLFQYKKSYYSLYQREKFTKEDLKKKGKIL